MAVERDWRNVMFVEKGGRSYSLGNPTLAFSPSVFAEESLPEDRSVLIGVRTAFGALPVLPAATFGTLLGSKEFVDDLLDVDTSNVEVVYSEPDKLILEAQSSDGVTSPVSFRFC